MEGKAALYRSVVDGKRLLVVVDNVSDADQVRPLLPASDGVATVVTSRNRLAGVVARHGAARLPLDVLSPADAVTLLRAAAGAERVDSDPESAARLVGLCAHLPLAVRIAAERCAHLPFTDVAQLVVELESEQSRLDVLSLDDDSGSAVRAVLSWSYKALSTEAAAAFRALGLHVTSDVGIGMAAVLLGTSEPRARRVMESLVSAHMAQVRAKDRDHLHDLLRACAIECASRFAEALDCLHRSLEIRVGLGDQRRVAITLGRLGSVYRDLGRLSESLDHLERSVALRRRIGDRHGEGFGLHSLAVTRVELGDHDEAVRLMRDAIRAHREVGNLLGEADVHACLGDALRLVHDLPGAVAAWRRAGEVYESIGSPQSAVVRESIRSLEQAREP